ncbi:MAG TPA: glycosyltransferase, partial [Bacteroidia bacterium]|nr:glycosyltransferase [Bacteroidia bacterium]
FPYAIDDHQSVNAQQLVAQDAAIVLPQRQLTADKLGDCISALSVDRQRLLVMAKHAHTLARPDATQAVVNQCLLLAGEFDYVR